MYVYKVTGGVGGQQTDTFTDTTSDKGDFVGRYPGPQSLPYRMTH